MKAVPVRHLERSFATRSPPTLWQRNALQNHGSVLLVNVLRDTKQPCVPPSEQTLQGEHNIMVEEIARAVLPCTTVHTNRQAQFARFPLMVCE